jgi:hypothetical protein
MIPRVYVLGAAVVGLVAGFALGQPLFWPLLNLSFTSLAQQWAGAPPDSIATAARQFSVATGLLCALFPVSALVTERFAARARYSQALAKSAAIGLLAFAIALLYCHQRQASFERLLVKMPGVIGPAQMPFTLPDNPLTNALWFTIICLAVFGPVDLWIAHLQSKRRDGG